VLLSFSGPFASSIGFSFLYFFFYKYYSLPDFEFKSL